MRYDDYLACAQELGYASFTELQDEAFRSECTYDENRNLMVIGQTSSGKTLVPALLYYAVAKQAAAQGRRMPKMLFVVPYRALAAQKLEEFQTLFRKRFPDIITAQSTAEYRQDDPLIRSGQVDISVMINEKVFLFACEDISFFQQFDMIVLDEIGLIADADRGIKLDLLLIWLHYLRERTKNCPRVIALATPYYDWSVYAERFGFSMIASTGRPTLIEMPVFYQRSKGRDRITVMTREPTGDSPLPKQMVFIREAADGTKAMTSCPEAKRGEEFRCPADKACRSDLSLTCPEIGAPCIRPSELFRAGVDYKNVLLARICRWHLRKGHQVLIFMNNRESVRAMAAGLYQLLKDELPPAGSLENCRRAVLTACSRTDAADQESSVNSGSKTRLDGSILTEDELFGILDDEHYLALCSGIGFHSAALPNEVRSYVEQAFLEEKSLKIVCSTETLAYGINSAVDAVIIADMKKNTVDGLTYLSANEYQNYSGRAGRLRPGVAAEDIIGYVYPLVSGLPVVPNGKQYQRGYQEWLKLQESSGTPHMIHSRLFDHSEESLPFFLLALLQKSERQALTAADLLEQLRLLPQQEAELSEDDIREALLFLEEHQLVTDTGSDPRSVFRFRSPAHSYYVSEIGANVRGYTPGRNDYELILQALRNSQENGFDSAVFLLQLLPAACLRNHIHSIHLEKDRFPAETLREFIEKLPIAERMRSVLDFANLNDSPTRNDVVLTAAVLCWADSETPRDLYTSFGIIYPLLQALTQMLSYLLDIAARSLHVIRRQEWESHPDCEMRRLRISEELQQLSRSVFYGIEWSLYEKMLQFFRNRTEPEAGRILSELTNPQPSMARRLRRISTYFHYCMSDTHTDPDDPRRTRYYREINRLGPLWREFFRQNIIQNR